MPKNSRPHRLMFILKPTLTLLLVCGLIVPSFLLRGQTNRFVRSLLTESLANAQAQPTAQVVAAWPLDEGTGTAAKDTSGNGSSGTLEGSAGWAAHARNGKPVLSLGGRNGYVSIPKSVIDTRSSFTVSAWVKMNDTAPYQTFVSQDGSQISGFFLQSRAGNFSMTMPGSDTATQAGAVAQAPFAAQAGVWYYLVGVHNAQAQTVSLYVNGVLASIMRLTTPWQAMGHTAIGRALYNGNKTDFVNGEISDVHIYHGVYINTQKMAAIAQANKPLPPVLTVSLAQQGPEINPSMFGLMIEDINHSIDGGLYAELIQNRVFKDSQSDLPDWSFVPGTGTGTMALDANQSVPGTALNRCVRLDINTVGAAPGVGIANSGYWGIPVRPNTVYHASIYAKGGGGFTGPLTLSIESNDGASVYAQAVIPALTSDWKQYFVTLKTAANAPVSEDNRYLVSAGGIGTVWLTQVSLFPPTYNNRPNGTRIDLMDKLAAMHPGFLRLPGGNYLEGNDIPNRFEWTRTIGPISQRPGHEDPWGYRSDDGFGLLEYLEWCEDLHMEPLLAVYAGYSLEKQHVDPGPALQPFVQDALNEIQYVTGSVHTKWGAIRAADGHPAPFALRYVEIGNEDFFDQSGSYSGRYAQFYHAIKAKYPDLRLIATTGVKGLVPDMIDQHRYPSPAAMEGAAHYYDNYKRSDPKIFVGEYASQEGRPTPDMNAALGDAAWMTGMERNADVVRMASYAPLLVNVSARSAYQWNTNLIGYDALHSYGSPSYYVQQMFSIYKGSHVAPISLTGQEFYAVASRDSAAGTLYIIMVNTSGQIQNSAISLTGAHTISHDGTAVTLSAATPQATNTLADPNRIAPVSAHVSHISAHFHYSCLPYSVTVLELKAK